MEILSGRAVVVAVAKAAFFRFWFAKVHPWVGGWEDGAPTTTDTTHNVTENKVVCEKRVQFWFAKNQLMGWED